MSTWPVNRNGWALTITDVSWRNGVVVPNPVAGGAVPLGSGWPVAGAKASSTGGVCARLVGSFLPVGLIASDRREVIVPGAVAFPATGVRLLAEHKGHEILRFSSRSKRRLGKSSFNSLVTLLEASIILLTSFESES